MGKTEACLYYEGEDLKKTEKLRRRIIYEQTHFNICSKGHSF